MRLTGVFVQSIVMTDHKELRTLAALYITLVVLSVDVVAKQDCNKVFSSYQLEEKKGIFQSPGYPSHYQNGITCKYKFIGRSNERVKIQFTSFALQGRPPRCTNDYVNIYSQLKHESDDLFLSPKTGPFCGESRADLPELVVSTNNILIIWFYSNEEKSYRGFQGNWEFIDSDHYDMGTLAPQGCGYTILSQNKKRGYLVSPTYPGAYPDNLKCYYVLRGRPGERIKLTFEDFSLFHGEDYCPFDYLEIYDDESQTAQVIHKFCGTFNHSEVVYSSGPSMRLHFVTGEGRVFFDKEPMEANADFKFSRRGFNISYVFSEEFVAIRGTDYVKKDFEHVAGTECDLRIFSQGETNGRFQSPGYPANTPGGTVCKYYLDGLMDDQHLEKVKVNFYEFNITGNMPYCELGYVGENEDSRFAGKSNKVKYKYCGSLNPPDFNSEGPRMVITLNTTGSTKGGYFLAGFKFQTDFGIKGEQVEDGKCHFRNRGLNRLSGEINSPRHPRVYPVNKDCEYEFKPTPDQMVMLRFSVFSLPPTTDAISCRKGDYIAFYENFGHAGRENYTLTEKYCGQAFPGPYVTPRMLKVYFHSDNEDTAMGFLANYEFVLKSSFESLCSTYTINARGSGGVIMSPYYPQKYPSGARCEWVIQASQRDHKILVEITDLSMEGVFQTDDGQPSCPDGVLRFYNDQRAIQPMAILCGKKGDQTTTATWDSYVSRFDTFRITFLTAKTAIGAKGFKLSWTEIHIGPTAIECSGFLCLTNKYCIASALKCNGEPNCGNGDDSDEVAECPKKSGMGPKPSGIQILHIAIGTSISSFFCLILLTCGFYHRRKFRSERAPPDHDHVEVRYVSAPTGCNTTDRLLMEDRNDNLVYNEPPQQHPLNPHQQHLNSSSNSSTSNTQSPRCQKVSMV